MTSPVPYIDPARQRSRIKPLKAWKHMQNLIADKEDTAQVFHIIEALNGNVKLNDFERFMSSENGPALLAERSDLPTMLDNHAPLEALPEGTVGREYIKFMQSEGLSAAGLVAESEVLNSSAKNFDDDLSWYMNRGRDTHDLYHVLTGYGRDALGEAALLGYTHSQHGGLGISFIAFMGGIKIAQHAPRNAKVKAVIAEGRRNGKAAARIVDQDIDALLREPIADARKRMNISEPVLYKRALDIFSEYELEPSPVAA
jgi:ubiquinone biosynthesis protein COQ4